MITSTTFKCYAVKILRGLFIIVVMAYAVMALGLWVTHQIAAKVKVPTEAISAHSNETHKLRLLDQGAYSFHERLRLIENAKKSIEIEFFIYNVDRASRIFTQALIEKAKQGVKVRVLVDFSSPVFQLRPAYARLMKERGIETRYYNTSGIYRILSMQHRSHRKFLIVDDQIAITGGRNIGDEYFDMSPDYNFLDTDIEVNGPLVAKMRESFDVYWNSNLSEAAHEMPASEEELKQAREFFEVHEGDVELKAKIVSAGEKLSHSVKVHNCNDISFDTDFPNQGEANRRVFKAIAAEMQLAKSHIIAESPYFVIKEGGYKLMRQLHERGITLKFLTNSLYSTDAFYTVASLLYNARWLAKTGMTVYAYNGDAIPVQASREFGAGERWGLHSKRGVVDGKTVLIGTYNIDPRSANLNSELMVICRNQPEFAAEVLKSIEQRIQSSRVIIHQGETERDALLKGSTAKQIAIFLISLPLSNLFDFLL